MHVATTRAKREEGQYVQRRLTSYGHLSHVAGACPVSLDYRDFERAVLFFLRELNPADLSPDTRGASRLREAEQELAGAEEHLAELRAELNDRKRAKGQVGFLTDAIYEAIDEVDGLRAEVEALKAEQSAERPLHNAQAILSTMATLDGEALHDGRLRLRAMLADLVEAVWVYPEKMFGRVHAVAQVRFRSGDVRHVLISGRWQHCYILGDGEGGERSDDGAIQELLCILRKRAERLAQAPKAPELDTVPETVGAAAEIWLAVVRASMKKASFRVVPSKVRRFVTFLGTDLPTTKIDTERWQDWVRWLRAEIGADRLEGSTARVTYRQGQGVRLLAPGTRRNRRGAGPGGFCEQGPGAEAG